MLWFIEEVLLHYKLFFVLNFEITTITKNNNYFLFFESYSLYSRFLFIIFTCILKIVLEHLEEYSILNLILNRKDQSSDWHCSFIFQTLIQIKQTIVYLFSGLLETRKTLREDCYLCGLSENPRGLFLVQEDCSWLVR